MSRQRRKIANKQNIQSGSQNNIKNNDILSKESKRLGPMEKILIITNIFLAIATCILAWTSWQSVNIIERNSQIELRAYVNVLQLSFFQFKVDEEIILSLKIENIGSTPAYNLKVIGFTKYGGTGIYNNDWDGLKDTLPGANTLGAGGIITNQIFHTKRILTQNDSINIMNGTLFFAHGGKIYYYDIFDNLHLTRFAYIYDASIKQLSGINKYNIQG